MMPGPSADAGANCLTAVKPIVVQGKVQFDAQVAGNEGSTALVLANIPAGESAAYSGTVTLNGCNDVLVEVDYISGDDCDRCTTPDVMVFETVEITMTPGRQYMLPDGFWGEVRVTVLDGSGAPVNLTGDAKQMIELYSGYKPACPECTIQVPNP